MALQWAGPTPLPPNQWARLLEKLQPLVKRVDCCGLNCPRRNVDDRHVCVVCLALCCGICKWANADGTDPIEEELKRFVICTSCADRHAPRAPPGGGPSPAGSVVSLSSSNDDEAVLPSGSAASGGGAATGGATAPKTKRKKSDVPVWEDTEDEDEDDDLEVVEKSSGASAPDQASAAGGTAGGAAVGGGDPPSDPDAAAAEGESESASAAPPKIELSGDTAPQVASLDQATVASVLARLDPLSAPSVDACVSKVRGNGTLAVAPSLLRSAVANKSKEEALQAIINWRFLSKTQQQAEKTRYKELGKKGGESLRSSINALFGRTTRTTRRRAAAASSAGAAGGEASTGAGAPPAGSESGEADGDVDMMMGRGSSDEDRNNLANDLEMQRGARRKVDTRAATVAGQSDAVSNEGVDTAMLWAGKSSDRSTFPGRTGDQPRREVMYLEVNQVEDTGVTGGGNSANANVRREKTVVNVVASSPDAVTFCMSHLARAFGADAEVRLTYDSNMIVRDEESGKLEPAVESFVSARRSGRSGVQVNNVPASQVRASSAREPSSRMPADSN